MRIRSIKPEFYRSSDISVLDWETRFLFIALWSYVDDNGVGVDKLSAVAADLFADDLETDARETFARVSRGLQTLSEAGRITRYTVDGKDFLHVTNWERHQRIDKPNKARYPAPTRDDAQIREGVATPSRQSRETPATGTEEQRNRGTEEETPSVSNAAALPDDEPDRPDVARILDCLDAELAANDLPVPNRTLANRRAARLLLDKDQYTVEQVEWIIRWAQNDEFWMPNIRSMSKLRDKFPQLKAKATRNHQPSRSTGDIDWDAAFARAAARDQEAS